jgi:hypothetical protein
MTQQNLFEVDAKIITDTCRHCEHRQRWQCNSKVIQYCGVSKSNRTDNGLLKIKVTDAACFQFKSTKKVVVNEDNTVR